MPIVEGFNNYQFQAKNFVAFDPGQPMNYLLPALAEEVGELQGIFAKNFRKNDTYRLPIEKNEHVISELGDILWNVAVIAYFQGHSLSDIAEYNIVKLSQRKENNDIATIQRRES